MELGRLDMHASPPRPAQEPQISQVSRKALAEGRRRPASHSSAPRPVRPCGEVAGPYVVVHIRTGSWHRTWMRLQPAVWRGAAAAHHERTTRLLLGSSGSDAESHPIFNFLFTYLRADPDVLCRWSPGPSSMLVSGLSRPHEPHLWRGRGLRRLDGSSDCSYPVTAARAGTGGAWSRTASLLRATAHRPPNLHCYGLHEWAMLYRPEGYPPPPKFQQGLPLRVSQDELNRTVDSLQPRCTHYDAFRFFAPAAVPLNAHQPQPSRRNVADLTQPGCVHASMDLLRQALALYPHLPSEIVHDTLELAIDARLLDIRASPYDLRAAPQSARRRFDLSPVRVEAPGGRREFQAMQADLARRAAPLRLRLLACYDEALRLLDAAETAPAVVTEAATLSGSREAAAEPGATAVTAGAAPHVHTRVGIFEHL